MKIFIAGICGTFMAGIACLAKQLGHDVSGCDEHIYPPMSDNLRAQQICILPGYHAEHLSYQPDLIIVGNAMSRGNALIEAVLAQGFAYTSGPQWLFEEILQKRHVLAIAGTHGKTTTTSMLAWILSYAGVNPGFLIGGIAKDFDQSAKLGNGPYFVIEADEYDTAFFDKRPKFIHYHPNTLILNNLEFDHADIYTDLDAITTQFHYLLRTVPNNGLIISNAEDNNLHQLLEQGYWSPIEKFGFSKAQWQVQDINADGSAFSIYHKNQCVGQVKWQHFGMHNVANGLAAISAAKHIGIDCAQAIDALNVFQGVKRRMEMRGQINDITVYDDFAHHPTAIASTLAGLRKKVGPARIIAILELASYTMRKGYHIAELPAALREADLILMLKPDDIPQLATMIEQQSIQLYDSSDDILSAITQEVKANDHIVVMSNRGFDNIHQKILDKIKID